MSKLSPSNNKNNIVLIGHMGSGKSTLGSYLAKKLDYKFIDTDTEIINEVDMPISNFLDKNVIAFGGGAFQSAKVRNNVKKNATSIWLKCDLKTLALRCSKKRNRPLLQNKDMKVVLKELNKLRADNFSKANYTFNVSKKTKSKLAAEIINELSIYEKN